MKIIMYSFLFIREECEPIIFTEHCTLINTINIEMTKNIVQKRWTRQDKTKQWICLNEREIQIVEHLFHVRQFHRNDWYHLCEIVTSFDSIHSNNIRFCLPDVQEERGMKGNLLHYRRIIMYAHILEYRLSWE